MTPDYPDPILDDVNVDHEIGVDPEARVQEFKANLEADLASVESDFSDTKSEFTALESKLDRLARERDKLRRLVEEADGLLSSIRGDNKLSHAVSVPSGATYGSGSVPSQENSPTTNGSLTRRQMVLQILPGFHGETFTAGDVREQLVKQYLGGDEPPNFPQAINNLLKRMAEKGEIKSLGRIDGKYLYQENGTREESLNLEP